jgi:hypothetical protein
MSMNVCNMNACNSCCNACNMLRHIHCTEPWYLAKGLSRDSAAGRPGGTAGAGKEGSGGDVEEAGEAGGGGGKRAGFPFVGE